MSSNSNPLKEVPKNFISPITENFTITVNNNGWASDSAWENCLGYTHIVLIPKIISQPDAGTTLDIRFSWSEDESMDTEHWECVRVVSEAPDSDGHVKNLIYRNKWSMPSTNNELARGYAIELPIVGKFLKPEVKLSADSNSPCQLKFQIIKLIKFS